VVTPVLPSPRTWSPNDLVTAPRLRADLADAVALLAQRPYFAAQSTTGESITSGGDVTLTMDATLTDTWSGFSNPASNVYTCQLPGWYLCDARIPFSYTSSTPAQLLAGFSSSDTSSGATFYGAPTVNGSTASTVLARATDLIQMLTGGSAGTVTAVVARQDSGSTVTLNTGAPDIPTVSMRWVCATSGTQPLPVPPLTACPTPITSSWLNANLRDAIRFLIYPPVARAHYTAGSSTLANTTLASPAVVPLTTVDLDTYAGFTSGASAHYTAPVAGRYLFAGQVFLASSSTATWYACGLEVNGTATYWGGITRFAGTSQAGGAAVAKRLRLNAGDQVQMVAAQASGGAIAYNTAASNQTRLIAVWEGA
jgi:hypothetical protein